MPKWITKPAPVMFDGNCPTCNARTHPMGVLPFDEFLRLIVEDGGHFGTSTKLTRRAKALKMASARCSDGEAFVINDEDHAKLLAVLDGPTGRVWIPSYMDQCEPFVVAIESATSEKPE